MQQSEQNLLDMKWVEELTGDNIVALYDVVLDIRQELQLSDDPAIDVCPNIVRFRQLMPFDGINMRDKYSETRWKAVNLLKKKRRINDFEYLEGNHRWESKIRIFTDKNEFHDFSRFMDKEFEHRTNQNDTKEISTKNSIDILENVLLRFHSVVVQLRKRHDNRSTLDVSDEYDVQDLLNALLRIHFDDIRPERWTPDYAGKSARVDFLLKNEQIVLEVKKTRNNLNTKEIGDQLILDIARY